MDRQEARERLSIPHYGKIIISVGSLIPRKGYDILLDGFSKLNQRNLDAYLYIIGEGPERSFLEGKISELNLRERVHLMGELPNTNLAIWFNAADISVLASKREGWPNVIMESLACGTPVVATRVWGAPEILTSPEVGMLVEPFSGTLGEGMAKALSMTWNRDRIRAHVEQRNWLRVANEVKGVFSSVLNESVV
jgi:glycosyltransferase involved in cell wall biosynthesis